jgi:hypothetical protein
LGRKGTWILVKAGDHSFDISSPRAAPVWPLQRLFSEGTAMLRLISGLLVAAFMMSGCASMQRTLSYPASMPDADVWVGGHRYAVWFHTSDPTILLQRGPPQYMGRALAENYTRYAADATEPAAIWMAAGDAVLQQIGCHAGEVVGADQIREITYACVQGVDVAAAVAQHREQWRQGVRVDDPTAR